MKKKEFIPPIVRQVTPLELESAILGDSKIFDPEIQATGHEVEEFSTSSYWEEM